MEETPQERRRRSARERKRRERARQSPSKAAAARAADAQRRRWALLHETEYQRELRRRRERVRQRIKRLFATPEEIEARRKRERETTAARRKNWTPEEKEEKRRRDRERNAYKRFIRQQNSDGASNIDSDSWIAANASVSSENFLINEDEFMLPNKLQKKHRKKKRKTAAKSAKSGENHEAQLKKMVVVANHQHFVMSNLSSLWKNRKLCDAGIGNGKSTIRVHKVVLSAVCPKLLSVVSTDILSQKFLQVNFPEEVSTKALNAFAEYMYNGTLDLDIEILKQLKIIAKNLDIKEFEELCDDYLPNAHVIEVKGEISATERAQVEKDTAAAFGKKSNAKSQNSKKAEKADVISPSTETESDKDKYENSSSSSNQVLTSTTSPSLSSTATVTTATATTATATTATATATTASTSISSVPTSSTEFSIPFSQSTDDKSTKLKPTHSYETPLVSDVSSVSCMSEPICSQSNLMNEDSSKQLSRQSLPTPSLHLPPTSTNNQVMYPGGPFTTSADNQNFTRSTNVGVDTPHSQPNAMKGFPSKPLNRQPIPTSSIQHPSTSTNNEGMYPGVPFTSSGDNQGFTRSTNVGAGSPHSQPPAMKGFPSKPLNRQPIPTSSIQHPSTSNNNEGIYSGGHFATSGDNQGFTRSTNVGAAPAHTPKIGAGSPHNQPNAMKGFSSKPLNRQSIPTSSIQHPSTSNNNNNDGIYPGGHFATAGDAQGFMRYRNVGPGSPHSQPPAMKGFSSKPINRQPIPTSSIQHPSASTSCNNESLYPVGPFTSSGDNQGFMCYRNVGAGSPHPQPNAMKGFSSKPLNRQSMSTSSIQLPTTSTNNDSIYPVGPFTASGDNQSFARYMIVGAAPAHTPKIGAGFPYTPHF